MKIIYRLSAVIFLLLFITPSFAEEKILIEGKGFKNLVIGKLNNKDVIRILGKPDTIEQMLKTESRNYYYSELGLKINFQNGILNTISTLPNFDGRTSKGITLKSSLKDIEAAYGKPVIVPSKTKHNAKVWTYDGVIFWLKRSRYLNKFEGIDKIVIYNNTLRKSDKKQTLTI